MPSWNEKPVIIPEINVNLEHQCPSWCPKTHDGSHDVEHAASCYARPVAIPCPVKRSVVLTVTLGECTCPNGVRPPEGHWRNCPGRPIRIVCFIGGETWAESEVTDVEFDSPYAKEGMSQGAIDTYAQLCRWRWALVKALVTGASKVSDFPEAFRMVPAVSEMLVQRDAVFAALCEMARAECAARKACEDLWAHVAGARGWGYAHIDDAVDRVSAHLLAVYVEHLIEQVGVLP